MTARIRNYIVLLATGLGLLAAPVNAQEGKVTLEKIDIKGKPKDIKSGDSSWCLIWFDDAGWHIRAIASRDAQTFTGKIEVVDGKFTSAKLVRTIGKGFKPETTDMSQLTGGTKTMKLDIRLAKGYESGFDLKVDDKATALRFVLKHNDKEETEVIFVGAKGAHPKEASFYLPIKPEK
jgi:hypothetical protein